MISLISIAILFLVIALFTNAKPVACKKASKNKFVLSSARDLQTSNIIFTVGTHQHNMWFDKKQFLPEDS